MNWQKEKPTKAGWYVVKSCEEDYGNVYTTVLITFEKRKLMVEPRGFNDKRPLSDIRKHEFEWLLLEEV